MRPDDIDPIVPLMPPDDTTEPVLADGGRRKHFDADEVTAPLVPDLR